MVSRDAVRGTLRASLRENGEVGTEVTRLLVEDVDEGVNAAFDVRVAAVWAVPYSKGTFKSSVFTLNKMTIRLNNP